MNVSQSKRPASGINNAIASENQDAGRDNANNRLNCFVQSDAPNPKVGTRNGRPKTTPAFPRTQGEALMDDSNKLNLILNKLSKLDTLESLFLCVDKR